MADQRIPASQRTNIISSSSIPSDNTQSFSSFSGSSIDTSGLQNTLPNLLGTIEQPSYHWKFFIPDDLGLNTNTKFILAETGLTGFNITDVEVANYVGPNFQQKNMPGTEFTIKISEPYGMSFPDKMITAAAESKVSNFLKSPYCLSVDFLGYDSKNGAVKRPYDKVWIWRIMITDLQSDLDAEGGKHTIKAVAYDDIGSFDQFAMVKTPIQVDINKKEGKVGDIMQGLQDQLNKSIEKSYNVANGGQVPFIVEIKDEPYTNQSSGVARPFDHKVIRDKKHLDSSRNQGVMQLSRGTDLGRIVDYLMSVSETATQMINPDASPTEMDGEAKEFSTLHRVDATVENLSYDQKTQDYVRKVTFWIRGYETVRPISAPKGADDAIGAASTKLQFIQTNNYLKKEYQYLYTGENTEVLDFKISLNFNFVVAQPIMQGQPTLETSSPGIEFSPDEFNVQTNNQNWSRRSIGAEPISWCEPPLVSRTSGSSGNVLEDLGRTKDIDNIAINRSFLSPSYVQDGNDPRYHVNQAIEASNLRTRSVYSTILNQMYGAIDSNLNSIELTVRGDPYWLGVTNTEDRTAKPADSANYIFGEQAFLVKFFIPQGIDEEGMPILTLTDSYSGFYNVIKVTNKFNQGKFTQVLDGVRISTMQVTRLLGGQ
jgi:hypothetical protein